MQDWLLGMLAGGVWASVVLLTKIARSSELLAKDLGGLRFQVEQLQDRGQRISSELHAIKAHFAEISMRLDDERLANAVAELAQKAAFQPSDND